MDTAVLIPHQQQDGAHQAEKGGITDDFMFNNNVAGCSIYVRMGFLRKVYSLLSIQLLVTTIIAGTFCMVPELRQGIHNNPWVLLMCLPLTFGIAIALHIKRHQVPINFLLLGAFTILEAVTVGMVVSVFEVEVVLKALFTTLVIMFGLTAYTFQTKRDFTKMGSGLLIGLMMVISLGFLNIFMGSTGMDLVLGGGAAIIFSLFIIYDTQMMMTKLSPEEYILATINLYLDIVNLFLELLRIFAEQRR